MQPGDRMLYKFPESGYPRADLARAFGTKLWPCEILDSSDPHHVAIKFLDVGRTMHDKIAALSHDSTWEINWHTDGHNLFADLGGESYKYTNNLDAFPLEEEELL